MRSFALFFFALLLYFQYQLWIDDNGWRGRQVIENKVILQQEQNQVQEAENRALRIEVENLENSVEALEELARVQFNYVKKDEIFYIVSE